MQTRPRGHPGRAGSRRGDPAPRAVSALTISSGSRTLCPIVMRGSKRGIRILKDDLKRPPAFGELAAAHRRRIQSQLEHATARRPQHAGHRASQGRFAGSRFADDAQRFAGRNRQAHAVDSLDGFATLPRWETHVHILEVEQPLPRDHATAPASESSAARQQRTRWSGSPRSVCASAHAGNTYAQRGANRQPNPISSNDGTRPGMAGSSDFGTLKRGSERSKPDVYGVLRMSQNFIDRRILDHFARIHRDHTRARFGDERPNRV